MEQLDTELVKTVYWYFMESLIEAGYTDAAKYMEGLKND